MIMHIIGNASAAIAILCASIFALMTLDVIADLHMAKAINALPKDATLTESQREWLARNSVNKI